MLLPISLQSSLELPSAQYAAIETAGPILAKGLVTQEDIVNPIFSLPPLLNDVLANMDVSQNPAATIFASYCLVTAADMIPFVPCQPLAVALGAKLGFALAFPITAIGQTTAGILAFSAARKAANTDFAKETVQLNPEAMQKLEDLRKLTSAEEQGDSKILLALIGLRLAPFFPFSAGNYLLGGTTVVPLRLFIVATLMGCIASNFLSVTIGAGGAMIFAIDISF